MRIPQLLPWRTATPSDRCEGNCCWARCWPLSRPARAARSFKVLDSPPGLRKQSDGEGKAYRPLARPREGDKEG